MVDLIGSRRAGKRLADPAGIPGICFFVKVRVVFISYAFPLFDG